MKIMNGLERIRMILTEMVPGRIKIHDIVYRDIGPVRGAFGPFGYSFVLGIPEDNLAMGASLGGKIDKRIIKKYVKQIIAVFDKDRKCLKYH